MSRSWRELCLDGQLWSDVNLAPFANHLPITTLYDILDNSRPFLQHLSLQGMRALPHSLFYDGGEEEYKFYNLGSLDLRGCLSLSVGTLISLVKRAPNLRKLNLRGLRFVNGPVFDEIAKLEYLEELDISRCIGLRYYPFVLRWLFHLSSEQAARVRCLRMSGVLDTIEPDFISCVASALPNLQVLDLSHTRSLTDANFRIFAMDLEKSGKTMDSLIHLNISSCPELGPACLTYLAGNVPNLRFLELADLDGMFPDEDSSDVPLIALLRSLPYLERLDLEGTGQWGGVTDDVLSALTPPAGQTDVVGSRLVQLSISHAKSVTPRAITRLIKACPNLKVLDADVSCSHINGAKPSHANCRTPLRTTMSCGTSFAKPSLIHPSTWSTVAQSRRPLISLWPMPRELEQASKDGRAYRSRTPLSSSKGRSTPLL